MAEPRDRRVTDKIDPIAEFAALRERVSHVAGSIDRMREDVQRVADRVGDVVAMREMAAQDRSTMARIESSIAGLAADLQKQLLAVRTEQEGKWADHAGAHKVVDRKMNFAIGWVSGVGVFGALLVGMVVWVTDYRFTHITAEAAAIPALRDKIHTIELHLARDRGQQHPTNGETR